MPDGRPFPRAFAFLFLTGLLLSAPNAFAGPDFFGVKMKSEDFARNVMIRENYLSPDFTNERPGTDKRVYAFGYTSTFLGRGRGLSITVYNHSDAPIGTERLFRECVILTNDGHRYDRSQPEMEWRRDVLKPGEQATFNIAFPGVDVRTQDIRMIILSFDLGQTKIFLLPMPPPAAPPKAPEKEPEPVSKTKTPPPAKASSVKKERPKEPVAPKKYFKEEMKTAPAPAEASDREAAPEGMIQHCLTPLKIMQGFFRKAGQKFEDVTARSARMKKVEEAREEVVETEEASVGEPPAEEPAVSGRVTPFSDDKSVPPVYPEYQDYAKASQVIEGVTYNFRPDFRNVVRKSEAETVEEVTKDRAWSLDNPDLTLQRDWRREQNRGELPRPEAQVVVVNPGNVFLVFDAGLEDGVRPNSIVSVLRDGRRVGKAMVSKARDRVSAALILPEWRTRDAIRVGDVVSLME